MICAGASFMSSNYTPYETIAHFLMAYEEAKKKKKRWLKEWNKLNSLHGKHILFFFFIQWSATINKEDIHTWPRAERQENIARRSIEKITVNYTF